MGSVLVQFPPLVNSRHAPAIAPVGCGGVIFRLEDGQVVGEAVVAAARVIAILGEGVGAAVAVLVSTPIVGVLRLGFAPGVLEAEIYDTCFNIVNYINT